MRAPSERRRAPVGAVLVFVAAVLLYAATMASIGDLHGSDAAGRGLAAGFGAIFGLTLWLALAILLLLAFTNGRMPRWAAALMLVLHPLAGVAAFVAAALYGESGGWPILVPALLPPIAAVYALAMRLPALAALPPAPTSLIVGIAVAALCAVPFAASYVQSHPSAAEQARRDAEASARQAAREREEREARERELAAFKSLNPDSSLRDYLDYLAPGDARFREAVAGARLVKTRHGDAAVLLGEGKLGALQELWRIDVAPTADLCTAYGAALRAEAMKVERGRGAFLGVAMDLERQLPNIQWLAGAQCDLDEALTTLETNLRAESDSERLTKFADTVGSFRKRR